MRLALAASVALGSLFSSRAVLASPELDFGFGARSQALAGAGTATADDAAAVFQNPSGLARARAVGVSFGYASVDYALENDGDGAALPTVNALEAGVVVPGAIKRVPVAFGFALALPNGKLSRLREAEPSTPYWPLDDASPRLVDIGTGFAARPADWLVVGAGVGFVASLRGTFHVHGTAVARDGKGAEWRSNLEHAVDADLTASRFPMLGVGFLPTEALAVGLTYRGPALVEHRIEGVLDGTLDLGETEVPIRYGFQSRSAVGYMPAQVALGASYGLEQGSLATVEVAWQRYSGYRSPYTETASQIEHGPELDVEIPDTVVVPAPPAGFRDRFLPRVAVEPHVALARGLELELRAGYAFLRSPVPRTQAATRFLDLDRHLVTAGVGMAWSPPAPLFQRLELNLALADAIGSSRTSATVGGNTDRVSGHVLLLGLSLGLVFGPGHD